MSDPLKPSVALLSKLGSIAVHVQEAMSKKGHPLDVEALRGLVHDSEVVAWIKAMGVYMPVRR